MNELVRVIDCLNENQLKIVQSHLKTIEWDVCTVFDSEGDSVLSEVRNGKRGFISDIHPVANIMHEAFNRALLVYAQENMKYCEAFANQFPTPGAWNTTSYRESIQFLKYDVGERYGYHVDMAPRRDTPEHHRTHSIVLYLHEEFEGGRTIFPHKAFKPKAGQALIFPSSWSYPHQCEEISSGTKLAAVTWYYTIYGDSA